MDTLACYPVRRPARPKRIGSGNRRLGSPSPITLQSTPRDLNQSIRVGKAAAPKFCPQRQLTNSDPVRITIIGTLGAKN